MTGVESRLSELEAEVRGLSASAKRWKLTAVFCGLVVAGTILVACQEQGQTPGQTPRPGQEESSSTTRASSSDEAGKASSDSGSVSGTRAGQKEIRLESEDGTQELILRPQGLALRVNGKNRVVLQTGNTTSLVLGDSSGRPRASLLVGDGPAALSLLGPEGKDLAVLAANEDDVFSRMELFGGIHGAPKAALRVDRRNAGQLEVAARGDGTTTDTPERSSEGPEYVPPGPSPAPPEE